MLFVHLAHLTTRIKFGCGFNITPMWHPLRLAEDFAMADHLTGGRVIFGVGRGYHSRECETLGAPSTALDDEGNQELFEAQSSVGCSMLSITITSTGPRCESSLRPSCSCSAV